MKKWYADFTSLLLSCVFFCSCEADIDLSSINDNISYNPALLIPIVKGRMNLGDFLSNNVTNEHVDYTDFPEVMYKVQDTLSFSLPSPDVFSGTSCSGSIQGALSDFFINPYVSLPELSCSGNVKLSTGACKLIQYVDSIQYDKLTLRMYLSPVFESKSIPADNFSIKLVFNGHYLKNSNGNIDTLSFKYKGSGLAMDNEITNCTLIPDKNAEMKYHLIVKVKNGCEKLHIKSNLYLQYSFKVNSASRRATYGRFRDCMVTDTVFRRKFDLFRILNNGILRFENPQFDVGLQTNIGSYLRFNVDYLKSYQNADSSSIRYACFNNTSRSYSSAVSVRPSVPGEVVNDNLATFDKYNAATDKLFDGTVQPDFMEYKIHMGVDSTLSKLNNLPTYILPENKLKVMVKARFNLSFNQGSVYHYQDTINIKGVFDDLEEKLTLKNKDSLPAVNLICYMKNAIPLNADLEFFYLDSEGNKIDAGLKKNQHLNAAQADANGYVMESSIDNQLMNMRMSMEQISKMKSATQMIISIWLSGYDSASKIHLTQDNTLDFNFGLSVNPKIATNITL